MSCMPGPSRLAPCGWSPTTKAAGLLGLPLRNVHRMRMGYSPLYAAGPQNQSGRHELPCPVLWQHLGAPMLPAMVQVAASLLVATCVLVGPPPSSAATIGTVTEGRASAYTVGGPSAAPARAGVANVASAAEDDAKMALRRIDSALESALGSVMPGPSVGEEGEEALRVLVSEVWEVVDGAYADVRGSGFSHERWRALRDEALSKPLRSRAAAEQAIRRMIVLGVGDPYTRYLTRDEFRPMLKYDVSGVGINLGTAEDLETKTGLKPPSPSGVYVVGLISKGPASAAGVRQGDRVVSVSGAPTQGRSPFEVASAIQTSAESPLRIAVESLDGTSRTVSLDRPPTAAPQSPVKAEVQPRGWQGRAYPVGLIRLEAMNALAERDVRAAVRDMEAAGARELVLDLRDNRGGLVSEGIEVARLFLGEGATIVRTEGSRTPREPQVATQPPLTSLPLTVLVSGRTASAAEILAGALHDNCRGVLVGDRTYGKGLIQSVYELSDGSGLVVTVGHYLTPGGTDIDRTGVKPDFRNVPSAEKAQETLALCRAPRGA